MPAPVQHDFEDVFRAHLDYVWRVSRLLVGDAHADDVVQETFLVVRRRLPDFEGSQLRGWLYATTKNVARNHLRSWRRRLRLLSSIPEPAPEPHPEDDVARKQALMLLDEFIASLSPKKREAFVLHDLEGLTAVEIADAIGVPTRTVYSRLRAARQEFERFRVQRGLEEVLP